ncbi:MAG: 4Fe-4S dicluster domain-containing protein [Deltaproteobacteria bacterium]|nr:4Fe-4S dicluster domain-containing protein [Deltaproteobacteria bacterium]
MAKILTVNPELCTSCKLCELVCSVKKEGVSDPSRSRIHVFIREMEGLFLPVFCRHCRNPVCASVCPVEAIAFDPSLGRVLFDEDVCTGCGECLEACPLGGARWDTEQEKPLRCDFCEGDPSCVKYCSTGALQYVEADESVKEEMRQAAEKLYDEFHNVSGR